MWHDLCFLFESGSKPDTSSLLKRGGVVLSWKGRERYNNVKYCAKLVCLVLNFFPSYWNVWLVLHITFRLPIIVRFSDEIYEKMNILKNVGNQTVDGCHWLTYTGKNTMDVFQKYLLLCTTEEITSYRFGTTWGWVNNNRIFIIGWTIPLSLQYHMYSTRHLTVNWSLNTLTRLKIMTPRQKSS